MIVLLLEDVEFGDSRVRNFTEGSFFLIAFANILRLYSCYKESAQCGLDACQTSNASWVTGLIPTSRIMRKVGASIRNFLPRCIVFETNLALPQWVCIYKNHRLQWFTDDVSLKVGNVKIVAWGNPFCFLSGTEINMTAYLWRFFVFLHKQTDYVVRWKPRFFYLDKYLICVKCDQ